MIHRKAMSVLFWAKLRWSVGELLWFLRNLTFLTILLQVPDAETVYASGLFGLGGVTELKLGAGDKVVLARRWVWLCYTAAKRTLTLWIQFSVSSASIVARCPAARISARRWCIVRRQTTVARSLLTANLCGNIYVETSVTLAHILRRTVALRRILGPGGLWTRWRRRTHYCPPQRWWRRCRNAPPRKARRIIIIIVINRRRSVGNIVHPYADQVGATAGGECQ